MRYHGGERYEKTLDQQLDDLIEAFLLIKTGREVRHLLESVLTPRELRNIARRLHICRLLRHGMPQRDVARLANVGVATVESVSRTIQQGKYKFQ